MKQDFKYLLRVRYSECDAQKVVFNARYAEYVDLAATEYLRSMVGSYQDIVEKGIDFQVVNLNINWKASAYLDDVIEISVVTSHIGNTSYRFSFVFGNKTTGREIADAEATYVLVDPQSMSKMSIGDELRSTFLEGAKGKVVNQSGVDCP